MLEERIRVSLDYASRESCETVDGKMGAIEGNLGNKHSQRLRQHDERLGSMTVVWDGARVGESSMIVQEKMKTLCKVEARDDDVSEERRH